MKNKWDKAKTFIKEEVRLDALSTVLFLVAFSFGIGSLSAISMWFALALIFPLILGVLMVTVGNMAVKNNTMWQESKKRIDLIRDYNQVIDEIIRVVKSDAA